MKTNYANNILNQDFTEAEIFAIFDSTYCNNGENLEKTAVALGITYKEALDLQERFCGELETLNIFDLSKIGQSK